ncbi:hypothetical protein B0J15DRAFT_543862 [Fusarium solani]|uniref:Uncharacterized protein n=1 Tax=Fusarium solani TaxID=169388 RepID=A0A9P9KYN1_FUSSL|nr:uncharacterized protein B0J15DRAFT_543862 [Fusarium solani]KAH7270946.1 hypothetical protein B0J15DRAFT_543862 [Fusarium solani]
MSTSGCLTFSRDGITVQGGIGDIEFENIMIKAASLDVFIASKLDTQCVRASKVDIFSYVNIHGVELKAALHTEKAQDGEFRWTIYGEVEGHVTTSKIVPDLKDTFLDVSLDRLALIASNHQAPLGSYKGINYSVAKGFQFCASIDEYEFPEPNDFLHYNDVQLYLSTGASIGETYYALGASLKGDMTIFGKRAKFDCTIGEMVKIMATIEHFELGPLKVRGAAGNDPIVDIELSSSMQKVLIDGAIDLWALSAALHLEAEVYPKPKLDFWVDVSLSDWVKFKLQAKLTGDIDFKDRSSLANADFAVYGLMEQHILDNIIDMLNKQIKSMRDHADFDKAKQILSNKENEFNASVQEARNRLDEAKRNWENKEQDIISALDRAKSEAQSYKQQLEDHLAAAEKSYASAVTDLQRAQSQSEEVIRQAQSDLNQKRNAFKLIFGSARSDLEQTRKSFDEAIIANDRIIKDLEDLDRRLNEASLLDMPILLAEKAVKAAEQAVASAALEAARVVFEAAELVIQGSEFIATEAVIAAGETALDDLVKSEAASMETARAAFEELKSRQEEVVQRAAQALGDAEKRSPKLETSTQAKAVLADSQTVIDSMVSPSEKALRRSLKRLTTPHAADDAAEAIDDAVGDVGSALNDAGSAVEHAAEDVVEAIDDAMNDVGSALDDTGGAVGHAADDVASAVGHAASDVGHAVEDVASDIGNAFNDAGSAVENVANDVANTISGLFPW